MLSNLENTDRSILVLAYSFLLIYLQIDSSESVVLRSPPIPSNTYKSNYDGYLLLDFSDKSTFTLCIKAYCISFT